MGLGDVLGQVRGSYVDQLTKFFVDTRDAGERIRMESVLRNSDGEPVLQGELKLPVRADATRTKDSYEPFTVEVEPQDGPASELLRFDWETSLNVTVGAFEWQRLEITLTGAEPPIGYAPVWRWYSKWFRPNIETRFEKEELLLSGAVHSLEGPNTTEAGAITMLIDLGSAKMQAFEELLDACKVAGFTHAVIGNTQESTPG